MKSRALAVARRYARTCHSPLVSHTLLLALMLAPLSIGTTSASAQPPTDLVVQTAAGPVAGSVAGGTAGAQSRPRKLPATTVCWTRSPRSSGSRPTSRRSGATLSASRCSENRLAPYPSPY
jgi:hypothetical protein